MQREQSAATPTTPPDFNALRSLADRLRRHSLTTTSLAKSGHPTTCMSAADLTAVLFARYLRFDLDKPKDPRNDRFVLSKGHAAPLLWAALAEAGAFPVEHLKTLRRIDSDLEGHPTPRNKWVDVASGSLGQGLSIGVGMAVSSRLDQIDNRIYVLLGDGESAEGSVWEALSWASYSGLDNLIAIFDINALGQSQRTMYGHHVEVYRERLKAFGWRTKCIDGHDLQEVDDAFDWASQGAGGGRPSAIVARTNKGQGVSFLADKDGWHGKTVNDPKQLQAALDELNDDGPSPLIDLAKPISNGHPTPAGPGGEPEPPAYQAGDQVATRVAYGEGLRKLGDVDPRVMALDGDTKNSTYSQKFLDAHPERFVECFIAEQNMLGIATGLSALGKIPFSSTFAAFLTRTFDQVRMGAVSRANLKICGSHAGVSIGEDGPSQMGLEDLAMMRTVAGSTVFYPSDGVSAERAVALAAQTPGIVYIRTSRPKTPLLYENHEEFRAGQAKILRSSDEDRVTLVAGGVTLHESLAAADRLAEEGISGIRVIDLFCVKPVDEDTLRRAARETGCVISVEDHYPEGGLGDAVLSAIAGEDCRYFRLAVNGLPRSGPTQDLLEEFGIGRGCIVEVIRSIL